jgi:hypothetical protein
MNFESLWNHLALPNVDAARRRVQTLPEPALGARRHRCVPRDLTLTKLGVLVAAPFLHLTAIRV